MTIHAILPPPESPKTEVESLLPALAGFTLIWMSILITVAALIFVSVLPGQEAGDINAKIISDVHKLERVEQAMSGFMAAHRRRPCPADGSSAVNTPYFGKEAINSGVCTSGGPPDAPLGPDAGTGNIVGGTIPVTSIGLDESYAFDEFGHRFTYIVDRRATSRAGCYALQNPPTDNGIGGLQINNTDANGTKVDNTMYAYISHGPSGYGAWPEQGAATPAGRINSGSTDSAMQTNAGVDVGTNPGASTFTYNTTNFSNIVVKKAHVLPSTTGGNLDTGFDDLTFYREDIKNKCCLGKHCKLLGLLFKGSIMWDLPDQVAMGDINGDGFKDMVMKATQTCDIYVVFGKTGRISGWKSPNFMTVGNGQYLDGTTGFRIKAPGSCTMAIGNITGIKVNGNSVDDIVISNGATTYVIFGKADWSAKADYNVTDFMDGVQGFSIATTKYIRAIGDFDGDGYADLIFSDEGGNGPSGVNSDTGSVYVVWGKADWSASPTYTLTGAGGLIDGTQGFEIDGPAANYFTGMWITAADINNDGKADLLISAPQWNPSTGAHYFTGGKGGYLYVVYGSAKTNWNAGTPYVLNTGAGQLIDGTKGFRLDGCTTGQELNNEPCSAQPSIGQTAVGDVNGDGLPDIVIGSVNGGPDSQGATFVVFGKPSWSASPTWSLDKGGSIIDGTHGFLINVNNWSKYGNESASVGAVAVADINRDGYADIIIGVPGWPTGNSHTINPAGSVFFVYGKSSWGVSNYYLDYGGTLIDDKNGFRLDGIDPNTSTGWSLATGDMNGDGFQDVFIGSSYESPNDWFGYSYLVFGAKKGVLSTDNLGMITQ